jgi:hypothetical protein
MTGNQAGLETRRQNMTTDTNKGKAPTHADYQIRDYKAGGENRSNWTRIGAVWAHKGLCGFLRSGRIRGDKVKDLSSCYY